MNTTNLDRIMSMINFIIARLNAQEVPVINLKDRIYLTFDEAIGCQELILALYQQTRPDFGRKCQPSYLAAVIVDDIQYVILGRQEDWKWFYSVKWEYLMRTCPLVIGIN